jgi:RecB family exonuclease
LAHHLSWADAQTVAIERRCQQRMLQRWLEIELARPAFSVAAREAEVELNIGPLQLKGQVDRIDQLDSGQTLIIDYKTGRASRNDWQPGSALASVQLPAYAVNLDPPPAALAYACLKPDEMAFSGLSDGSVTLAGVDALAESKKFNEIEDWAALTQAWRAQLDQLAEDFAGGWAAVAPRKPEVCQYCHLKSLCRIHERQAMMDEDGDDE